MADHEQTGTGSSPDHAPLNTAELMALVYDELRDLSRRYLQRERPDHTLQATALVHEAYVRLLAREPGAWVDPDHFFYVAARAVRRVLVDYARARRSVKRGGGRALVSIEVAERESKIEPPLDVLDLDDALEELARLQPRHARVVELRYFGGLSDDDVARMLGVSDRTVRSDWAAARAWLLARLKGSALP